LLTGIEPTAERWVATHAEGLVAMLLPNSAGVALEAIERFRGAGAASSGRPRHIRRSRA
jgi:hypothetical protein